MQAQQTPWLHVNLKERREGPRKQGVTWASTSLASLRTEASMPGEQKARPSVCRGPEPGPRTQEGFIRKLATNPLPRFLSLFLFNLT